MRDPLEEAGEEVGRPIASAIAIGFVACFVVLFVVKAGSRVPIALAVGLIVMVMLHECGHYYTAKKAGMKVTEFFVGFGPRVWSFRRGETEYGIKAVPAGGYVRIIGMSNLEEVDPADEDRAFRSKKFLPRFVVVLAGVTVNFVLAFVLFFALFAFDGIATKDATTKLIDITPGSPADDAGLRTGDTVLAIGDTQITNWDQVSPSLEDRAGKQTTVVVERDGREQALNVTPAERAPDDSRGCLGVRSQQVQREASTVGAGKEAGVAMGFIARETGGGLVKLFSVSGLRNYSKEVAGDGSAKTYPCAPSARPSSIIGIVDAGSRAVGTDVWTLMWVFGVVSLLLGLFNLLPVLPFDGGHAVVAIYEEVRGRIIGRPYRADFRKLIPVTAVVLFVLLTLSLSAAFLDVRNIGS